MAHILSIGRYLLDIAERKRFSLGFGKSLPPIKLQLLLQSSDLTLQVVDIFLILRRFREL